MICWDICMSNLCAFLSHPFFLKEKRLTLGTGNFFLAKLFSFFLPYYHCHIQIINMKALTVYCVRLPWCCFHYRQCFHQEQIRKNLKIYFWCMWVVLYRCAFIFVFSCFPITIGIIFFRDRQYITLQNLNGFIWMYTQPLPLSTLLLAH